VGGSVPPLAFEVTDGTVGADVVGWGTEAGGGTVDDGTEVAVTVVDD
jgi:hypothetical protein